MPLISYFPLSKLCGSSTLLLFLVCLLFKLRLFLPMALMGSGWLVFYQLLMFSLLFGQPKTFLINVKSAIN